MPFMRFERFRFLNDADVPAANVQATGYEAPGPVADTDPLLLANVAAGVAKEGKVMTTGGGSGDSTLVRVTFTYTPTGGAAMAVDKMLPNNAATIMNDATARFYKDGTTYYLTLYGCDKDKASIPFYQVAL